MKSRFLVVLMTCALGATSLAACGGGGDGAETSGTSGSPSGDTSAEASESSEDLYNVVMTWPNLTGGVPEGLADVEAAINAITEPEIGVTVTLEPIDFANLASEQSLMISSGEKLDLIVSVGTGVSSLVNSGSIIPLDDLYAQYGADIEAACGVAVEGGGYYDNTPVSYTHLTLPTIRLV